MKPLYLLRFVLKMPRAYSKDVSIIFFRIYDLFLHSQQQKMDQLAPRVTATASVGQSTER